MSEPVDDIEALLPWYAAGALSPPERARVEAALAARPALAANLASAQDERDETVALNEALGAPRADVWARIAQGIEAAPKRRPLGERLGAWLGLNERPWLAFAATAAAALVLVQAATIAVLLRPGAQGGFQTVAEVRASADVLVAFTPEAKLADVAALLARAGATLSGGPKPGGMYELRFKTRPASRAEFEAALKVLTDSPLVRLALPGAGGTKG